MTTAEERYQLIMTYCDTFNHLANGVIQGWEALLANGSSSFNDEQRTDIGYTQNKIRNFLSAVKTVHQLTLIQRQVPLESKEFIDFIVSLNHELHAPLLLVVGYAQLFLDGGMGPLSDRQREEMENIYKTGRGLLTAITE